MRAERLHILLLACTLAVGLSVARAQESAPTAYECRLTAEAIVIDGKLDEETWKHAAPLTFMVPVTHKKPQTATIGRIAWDKANLYVAFEAVDEDLKAVLTGHDSPTYKDDVLEVFFQPSLDGEVYHNIEINALGTVFDAIRGTEGKAWTCENMKTSIVLDGTINDPADHDKGWTMEVAIPFASLPSLGGAAPKAGDEWKLHLARYDYSAYIEGGKELSSCAPLTKVNFHHRPDWLTLRFAAAAEK